MMRRVSGGALLVGLLAAAPVSSGQGFEDAVGPESAPKLHRNPFERPGLVRTARSRVATAERAPPPWTPELRATLVAGGGSSLANVDGEMVKKGEEYQGYTLVDVREREAVFERGGKRWVLSLD